MKKTAIGILAISMFLLARPVLAQDGRAAEAAADLSQVYSLNEAQQAEMLKIQARKYRNLAEVAPLQEQDLNQYFQKIKALQFGHEKSVERMLDESQLPVHRQRQTAFRERRAALVKTLKDSQATEETVTQEMLRLYLEALD
ncbi:MAG: hypothetical protein RLY31_611 [Bacteroidota bacterium]|jgi:hypothetical protein